MAYRFSYSMFCFLSLGRSVELALLVKVDRSNPILNNSATHCVLIHKPYYSSSIVYNDGFFTASLVPWSLVIILFASHQSTSRRIPVKSVRTIFKAYRRLVWRGQSGNNRPNDRSATSNQIIHVS